MNPLNKKTMYNALIVLFAFVFILSAFMLVRTKLQYRKGDAVNQKMVTLAAEKTLPAPDGEEIPSYDFNALKTANSDIVAWIFCEGTPINFPILQAKDNDYYLRRLADKSYGINGSIFMDYRNSANFSDRHTIIYGHNMKNGSMFECLCEYQNQKYLDAHPFIWICTPEHTYKLEIFSAAEVTVDSDAYSLDLSDTDFETYLEKATSRSVVTTNCTLTSDDRIVTLSTCVYTAKNARFIVQGKLVEKY